jgi:hypothetical protein
VPWNPCPFRFALGFYLTFALGLLGLLSYEHVKRISAHFRGFKACSVLPCSVVEVPVFLVLLFYLVLGLVIMGARLRIQVPRHGSQKDRRWLFISSDSDEALTFLTRFSRKSRNLLPHPRLDLQTVGSAWGSVESRSHFTYGRAKRHSDVFVVFVGLSLSLMGWLVFSINQIPSGRWTGYVAALAEKSILWSLIMTLAYIRIPSTSMVRYVDAIFHLICLPYEWLVRGLRVLKFVCLHPARLAAHRAAWNTICRVVLGYSDTNTRTVPDVTERPDKRVLNETSLYEELSPEAVKCALERRRKSAAMSMSTLSDVIGTADTVEQLGDQIVKLAGEIDLVHSAYMQDTECIKRIARWIALKE